MTDKPVAPAPRPCTCHPDDSPPVPCPQKFALSECRSAAPDAKTVEAIMALHNDAMGADAVGDIETVKSSEAALRAAVEQMVRERDKWKDEHFFQACLTRDLLPYQERAERAEQDAARYRWLRDGYSKNPPGVFHPVFVMRGGNNWHPTLDAAIDAAMKEGK